MKMVLKTDRISIVPESDQDEAYLNDTIRCRTGRPWVFANQQYLGITLDVVAHDRTPLGTDTWATDRDDLDEMTERLADADVDATFAQSEIRDLDEALDRAES